MTRAMDTSLRYLVGIPAFTVVFWLVGSYIQLDWLWFAHIARAEARAAVLGLYLALLAATISCPMLFPWRR